MSLDDIEYFRGRAAVERALAGKASDAGVAAIHEELARGYEALVRRGSMQSATNAPVVDQEQRSASG